MITRSMTMMRRSTVCIALMAAATAACGESMSEPEIRPDPTIDAQLRAQMAMWGVVPILPVEKQNGAMVGLGQALMFDKLLSGNRDVSCGTCHDPTLRGGDGLSLSVGTGGGGTGLARTPGTGRAFIARNAPSLLNIGLGTTYIFWDARLSQHGPFPGLPVANVPRPVGVSDALVAQAFLPVISREEMRGRAGDTDLFGQPNELAMIADDRPEEIWRAVMKRILAVPEYVTRFKAAFPSVPVQSFSFGHAATAIVALEKQA